MHRRSLDVLAIDPSPVGHHPTYLAQMIAACCERAMITGFISNPDLMARPEIVALLRTYGDLVVPIPQEGRGPPANSSVLLQNLRWWWWIRGRLRAIRSGFEVHKLLLPCADYALYAIALLGLPARDVDVYAAALRLSFMQPTKRSRFSIFKRLRHLAIQRILAQRRLKILFSIDELAVEAIKSKLGKESDKVVYLVDPARSATIDSQDARRSLRLSAGAFAVLVYGDLSSRKGIGLLLDCLERRDLDPRIIVVVAGAADDTVARLLREHPAATSSGRVHRVSGYVALEVQDRLFSAADCVWLAYQGHDGMSGVLVQAAKSGKPAIVSARGLMGHYVKRYGVGIAIPEGNLSAAVEALNKLASDPNAGAMMGRNGRIAFSGHSVEEFRRMVGNALSNTYP